MEITKMLTMSTMHIKESTAELLNKEPETNTLGLCVYPKCDFGYYITIDEYAVKQASEEEFPEDLSNLIIFAHDLDCKTLCLDCDAEVIPYLNKYDW